MILNGTPLRSAYCEKPVEMSINKYVFLSRFIDSFNFKKIVSPNYFVKKNGTALGRVGVIVEIILRLEKVI